MLMGLVPVVGRDVNRRPYEPYVLLSIWSCDYRIRYTTALNRILPYFFYGRLRPSYGS